MTSKAIRNIRKLERPRPLKLVTEVGPKCPVPLTAEIQPKKTGNDDVIHDLEALHISINNGNFDDSTLHSVVKICNQLKSRGQYLESSYKEQLDRYFVTLRNASRESRIDMKWRLRLLEIIELRAMGWKSNDNICNYYAKKILELEVPEPLPSVSPTSTPISSTGVPITYIPAQSHVPSNSISQSGINFGPGEVLKSSGKFAKPTKMAGKNYFKDEIVIRNSDSGKVNPGAKDRLVQITGPNEESINRARGLIADTIRRNASPVREKPEHADLEDVLGGSPVTLSNMSNSLSEELSTSEMNFMSGGKKLTHSFSMSDASVGEYAYSVQVGRDIVKVSGTNVDLVRTSKLVLEEYFAGQAELLEKQKLQQVMDSNVGLHHSSSMYMNTCSYRQECGDWETGISPQSPQPYIGQSSKISYLCNGSNPDRETTPSSISSNEETYKAEEDNSVTDDLSSYKELSESSLESPQPHSDSKFLTSGRVVSSLQLKLQAPTLPSVPSPTAVEGPGSKLFQHPNSSCSSKEISEEDEVFTQGFGDSGHFRLANSGDSQTESGQCKDSFFNQNSLLPGGCRISYSRDFLLDCSHSPLSQNPPRNLLCIAADMPTILRETSINFDPDEYRIQFVSIPRDYCVGIMQCSEGKGVQDI